MSWIQGVHVLSIDRLSVEYYRRGNVIQALREVSLEIHSGETLGLVGESGSGKSTLALAILRLIRPQEGTITSGRILFKGQDLLLMEERSMRQIRGGRIGMIFQDPFTSLNPVMRIREQMEEILSSHPGDSMSLSDALAHVQLEPDRTLQSYPHQLSGGQRQRVLIASTLLTKPELIVADEPTTALDLLIQKDILELLFRLREELGMGMLFISHHLAVVSRFAQRIAVLKDGRLVEVQSVRELTHHPQAAYTQELLNALRSISLRREPEH